MEGEMKRLTRQACGVEFALGGHAVVWRLYWNGVQEYYDSDGTMYVALEILGKGSCWLVLHLDDGEWSGFYPTKPTLPSKKVTSPFSQVGEICPGPWVGLAVGMWDSTW